MGTKGGVSIDNLILHNTILLIAGLMITYAIWHSRILWGTPQVVPDEGLSKRWGVFLNRQHRRRLQIAVLIGLSGLSMLIGAFVPRQTFPKTFILVWLLAVLFLLWTILFALLDMVSISTFFSRSKRQDEAERAKFRYEIEQKIKEEQERQKNDSGDQNHSNSDS
ncbi:MAG: hypothetical protein FWC50_09665 [Planctomycetaceae bacterium]|nr:hypothetical protein [Planctomycetaceae bacterium]